MNKLIVIVGASGVGKTTLARALSQKEKFEIALEQHNERPFQALFKQDARYALANQMDYLLFRAEQERELRKGDIPALMDGGLDLDFHGFTRIFHTRKLLNDAEFHLCKRFYEYTRTLLPPPDLIILLNAPKATIHTRLESRKRINIASSEDANLFDIYLSEWIKIIPASKVIKLNAAQESIEYTQSVPLILEKIYSILIE